MIEAIKQIASGARRFWTLSLVAATAAGALMVLAVQVIAQEATPAVAPAATAAAGGAGIKEIISTLLVGLLGTLVFMLQKIGTKAIAKFGGVADKWITDKIQSEGLEKALLIVERNALTVAADIWQTEVSYLKEALKDGRLSKEEKARIRSIALEKIQALTPNRILATLRENGVDTGKLLSSVLEEAVVRLKLAKKGAANGSGAPTVPKV